MRLMKSQRNNFSSLTTGFFLLNPCYKRK